MSEELRLLREAAERKAAYTLEWEQRGWGARRDLEEAESPYRGNSYYIDKKIKELPNSLSNLPYYNNNILYNIYKESIGGRQFGELRGLVLYLQRKLNEHTDRHKKGKPYRWK